MTADALRIAERPWSLRWLVGTVRSGWPLVAAAALLGALLGLFAAGLSGIYQATTTLAVAAGKSTTETDTAVRSVASVVESDAVVSAAAATLGVSSEDLSDRLRTEIQSGTTLIDVIVIDDSADGAVAGANAVADAALAENLDRQADAARAYLAAGEGLLNEGQLSAPAAEEARQQGIGSLVGEEQGTSVQRALSVSLVAPASGAVLVGPSKGVALVFGAAAGILLSTLVVLSGALRPYRRIRRASDLAGIRSGREPRVAATAGILAGALLDSAKPCGALVELGRSDPRAGSPVLAEVTALLNAQGCDTAVVEVLGGEDGQDLEPDGDQWRVAGEAARRWLSRAGRRQLPQRVDSELVLLHIDAEDRDLPLLHGQSDFFCALLVRPGARLTDVERALVSMAAADPVVLMA